jgi:hypothetical protein
MCGSGVGCLVEKINNRSEKGNTFLEVSHKKDGLVVDAISDTKLLSFNNPGRAVSKSIIKQR